MSDLVAPESTKPQIAAWEHPLADPNIEDARITHKLARLAGVPGLGRVEAAYRKTLRLKSWQYMTAVTDELFIAFVVGTAGFASNGFVYAAELPSGRVHKRFAITPLMMGTALAPSSTAVVIAFARAGYRSRSTTRAAASRRASMHAPTREACPLICALRVAVTTSISPCACRFRRGAGTTRTSSPRST